MHAFQIQVYYYIFNYLLVIPVDELLELSSLVRAITIRQLRSDSPVKQLFNMQDWAQTIIDMFSRKMDTLMIYWYDQYIPAEDVIVLKDVRNIFSLDNNC